MMKRNLQGWGFRQGNHTMSQPEPIQPIASPVSAGGPVTALLLAGHSGLKRLVGEALKPLCRLSTAVDPGAGLEQVFMRRPDLLLVDVTCPHVADDLVARLRAHAGLDTMAVILLTPNGANPRHLRFMADGADEYLTTPFAREELRARTRNLLEVRSLRRELADTRRDLARCVGQRGKLIANMSHGFRSPLNAILGFADLMDGLGPSALSAEDFVAYVGYIRTAGLHMLELVDDLADVGRLDNGHIELNPTEFDLLELIQGVAHSLAVLAERKGIAVSLPESGCGTLHADPSRCRQILYNLMSNALKYTPRGRGVGVEVETAEAEVRISIVDSGVGIASTDQARVFEAFERIERPGEHVAGSGLGLTIARELVRAHGGTLELESAPGHGSRFTVRLPQPCGAP